MALIAVPNVSEGSDPVRLQHLRSALDRGNAHILDEHVDPIHNRSVFTVTAHPNELVAGLSLLAGAAKSIDLREHQGVHPRLGGLDVCPIVPFEEIMESAVEVAHAVGCAIADEHGLPVYFYGQAATRAETRCLPSLRKGGLEGLVRRAARGLTPDAGPREISLRSGVVCVGARNVLIAFNVWVEGSASLARSIASSIRTSQGGPPGVRALGLEWPGGEAQVSMNLIDPQTTNIDDMFEVVASAAGARGAAVTRAEIVGLVPERFLPAPDAPAARLLVEPGRSLESRLRR